MIKPTVVLAATFAASTGLLTAVAFADTPYRSVPIEPLSAGTRGYVKTPESAFVESHGPISHIIYLNRCRGGCTFIQGAINDALQNRTTITANPDGPFRIDEFAHSEALWDATVQCVREAYSPFNIQVVTEDPGAQVPHHEAVVAGTALNIMREDVLGIAPGTCDPKNNVISFSLANDHRPSAQHLCWTIAQESAHAFGLDHAFECTDPLTYIPDACGQKFFRNKTVRCGEYEPRNCNCQRANQNSHATLMAIHGPNATQVPGPIMNITRPAEGSMVSSAFSVGVSATDKRGVDRLEVWVNGWKWNQIAGSRSTSFEVEVPATLPNGVMDVTVKACNDLDICSEDTVTVMKGAPCASADACLAGQQCEEGKCFWGQPTGEIGDDCTFAQECLSETCVPLSSGGQICSENCVGGPNDACPDGFACSGAIAVAGVCAPLDDVSGCCSTGGGVTRGAMLANLGLGTLVGLLIAGRRRRRSART